MTDDLFRRDAEARGYLAPGGRGLAAYYRDHGMRAPGPAPKVRTPDGRKPREVYGMDLDRELEG